MQNTEILVHISAPSGARDDARYRAQVQAILGFEAVSRCNVADLEEEESAAGVASSVKEAISVSSSTNRSAGPGPPETNSGDELRGVLSAHSSLQSGTSPSSHMDSAQNTFSNHGEGNGMFRRPPNTPGSTSSACVLSSYRIEHHRDCAPAQIHQNMSQGDSFGSPISVIPDSNPEDAFREAKDPLESPDCKRLRSSVDQPFPASMRPASSQLPSRNDPKTSNEDLMPMVREKQEEDDDDDDTLPSASAAKDGSSRNSTPVKKRELYIPFPSLPLQIYPPAPPVSTKRFVTHVTPTLKMLEERLKPARTYKPVKQSRQLDTLERGYWFFRINLTQGKEYTTEEIARKENKVLCPVAKENRHQNRPGCCSSKQGMAHGSAGTTSPNFNDWDISFFDRFWTFLSDFISKEGRAGWGVWCILEDAVQTPTHTDIEEQVQEKTQLAQSTSVSRKAVGNVSSAIPAEGNPARMHQSHQSSSSSNYGYDTPSLKPLTLKIYAWGEIAVHVYLLLFLASERRVRKMGAQWRDSREKVIIQMP